MHKLNQLLINKNITNLDAKLDTVGINPYTWLKKQHKAETKMWINISTMLVTVSKQSSYKSCGIANLTISAVLGLTWAFLQTKTKLACCGISKSQNKLSYHDMAFYSDLPLPSRIWTCWYISYHTCWSRYLILNMKSLFLPLVVSQM